jgi:hypothetical protein
MKVENFHEGQKKKKNPVKICCGTSEGNSITLERE